MLPDIFDSYPAVYAVCDRYVVTVTLKAETLFWVRVGNDYYYDDSNGILRSSSLTHKAELPMEVLDKAGKYVVCFRRVKERKPYFSDVGEVEEYEFDFCPVRNDNINVYHIADAHNRVTGPVKAGEWFGDNLDLLILNGDIPNHSGDISYFSAIHRIAGEITKGKHPVIFSRGNHDTRGIYAENLPEYTPTDNGRSYFTVRLGKIWALVLDCAEDKPDTNAEYGHTICCHDFRLRETKFLEKIAQSGEYDAEGIEHKIVIVHSPFTDTFSPPFDIEQELYSKWCEILREKIKPEIMICGHVHNCYVTMPGDEKDKKGQPCPVVCASSLGNDFDYFKGGAFTFGKDGISVRFTDSDKNSSEEIIIKK